MYISDVTTLYKGKGNHQDVVNWRGIFQLAITRNILDRLVYNEEYATVSSNIGCFQAGSQKGRSIRDHTFILHASINEAKIMKRNIDVNFYDIGQCFDSVWLSEAINDLYDSGVRNRNLNILFNGNLKTSMSVKTVFGKTKRTDLQNILLQGSVTGPVLTSNQISKHSNKSFNNGNVYMYMNKVPIAPLSLVDDVATIVECNSIEAIGANIKNDIFFRCKKMELQVAKGKCQYIHCGSGKCKSEYFVKSKKLE